MKGGWATEGSTAPRVTIAIETQVTPQHFRIAYAGIVSICSIYEQITDLSTVFRAYQSL